MALGVAVKGIIRRDGKILVLRRAANEEHKPNIWETVGGRIDEGEVPEEALRREILEETNLEVEIEEPFNIFNFKRDTGEFIVGITFLCDWVSGEVQVSEEEHSEFKWIESREFENMESVPSLHSEIKKYSEKYHGEKK